MPNTPPRFPGCGRPAARTTEGLVARYKAAGLTDLQVQAVLLNTGGWLQAQAEQRSNVLAAAAVAGVGTRLQQEAAFLNPPGPRAQAS